MQCLQGLSQHFNEYLARAKYSDFLQFLNVRSVSNFFGFQSLSKGRSRNNSSKKCFTVTPDSPPVTPDLFRGPFGNQHKHQTN